MREVIVVYKHIFGALLNLDKSIIFPMYDEDTLDWFHKMGCKIA